MNLKNTINYKMLRDQGKKVVDIKDDEVIQLVTKEADIKVIITQEHYLNLLMAHNSLLKHVGLKKEETVEIDFSEKIKSLENRFEHIAKLVNEDKE